VQGCIFNFKVVPCWRIKTPKYLEKRTRKQRDPETSSGRQNKCS
jgi:hypothetical protein